MVRLCSLTMKRRSGSWITLRSPPSSTRSMRNFFTSSKRLGAKPCGTDGPGCGPGVTVWGRAVPPGPGGGTFWKVAGGGRTPVWPGGGWKRGIPLPSSARKARRPRAWPAETASPPVVAGTVAQASRGGAASGTVAQASQAVAASGTVARASQAVAASGTVARASQAVAASGTVARASQAVAASGTVVQASQAVAVGEAAVAVPAPASSSPPQFAPGRTGSARCRPARQRRPWPRRWLQRAPPTELIAGPSSCAAPRPRFPPSLSTSKSTQFAAAARRNRLRLQAQDLRSRSMDGTREWPTSRS